MQTENEVKFLKVDIEAVREKLKQLGATCLHEMRLMRRVVMDYPGHTLGIEKDSFIRVRDEGDKITVTYQVAGKNIAGDAREIPLRVDSYERAVELFKAIGLISESEQESRRETWEAGDCEVVIDEWPWLNHYVEIEGPSQVALRATAASLGFDWSEAVFGSATEAYKREYPGIKDGETIAQIPVMRFDDPLPEWLALRKTTA